MATFEYKALQANGAPCEGRVDAGGRQEAMRLIEERGLTPLRLSEMTAPSSAAKIGSEVRSGHGEMGIPIDARLVRGAGGFHTLAIQPAHRRRAAQPRPYYSLQGSVECCRRGKMARTA